MKSGDWKPGCGRNSGTEVREKCKIVSTTSDLERTYRLSVHQLHFRFTAFQISHLKCGGLFNKRCWLFIPENLGVLILVQLELPGVLICKADSRVRCPEVLIQQVWGGTQKFAFFRSSWAILSNTDPSIALL